MTKALVSEATVIVLTARRGIATMATSRTFTTRIIVRSSGGPAGYYAAPPLFAVSWKQQSVPVIFIDGLTFNNPSAFVPAENRLPGVMMSAAAPPHERRFQLVLIKPNIL